MTSRKINDLLTRIGPGTKMGELLRRYWHPIAAVSELDEKPIKRMRLFGEDLVLYRDLGGTYGLVGRHCPHRNADLSNGYVEACGIRCAYHGWLFDQDGRCLEQPYEDTVAPSGRFRRKLRHTAYKVMAKANLLWAYLGPDPAPLIPDLEPFSWQNCHVQIVFAEVPCNWLQAQENAIDPVHFEWMHLNWKNVLEGRKRGRAPRHLELGFDEHEFGFVFRRVSEGTDKSDPLWTEGRFLLWPNGFYLPTHIEWHVPIDDENMLFVAWVFRRVPNEQEPYVQEKVPHWYSPLRDERGEMIISHLINQDFLAWTGQGRISDRSKEHLGQSDAGVIMVRKRFLDDLKALERGEDPKAIIRDEARNRSLVLPMTDRDVLIKGIPAQQLAADPFLGPLSRHFYQLYGQPEWVARDYERAMGFAADGGAFVDQSAQMPPTRAPQAGADSKRRRALAASD